MMSAPVTRRFRAGSGAFGLAALLSCGLLATAANGDMQGALLQQRSPVHLGGVTLPADIQFKGLPATLQVANLFGNPAEPGIYVQRIKFPAGIKLMPHSHPDQPRTVAVLSGTLYYALGENWDERKLQAFPAGTFFTEAPRVFHYAWAKDGEVVLQLTSVGPTGTVLAKPAAKE